MIRVEKNKLLFIKQNKFIVYIVEKENYQYIINYLIKNKSNFIIENIRNIGMLEELNSDKIQVMNYMNDSLLIDTPKNALSAPLTINMEVTTKCILKCPQCYCHLNKGKNIDKNNAINLINEAGNLKVPFISFSGGETLEYSYIYNLIECCTLNNIYSSIAISGVKFNNVVLKKLIKAGIGAIYVSLNGSNKNVNSKSRDGYELAINSLEILKQSNFENYYINWVAHDYNICDFKNVVNLAKLFDVKKIIVLALKPDSNYELAGAPKHDNFVELANFIKNFNDDNLGIEVESCYAPLNAYISGTTENTTDNILKNCGAGKTTMSISVDCKMSPCRHLNIYENKHSIKKYWNNSQFVNKLRNYPSKYTNGKCANCIYNNKCIHCAAINYKIDNRVFNSNEYCSLN